VIENEYHQYVSKRAWAYAAGFAFCGSCSQCRVEVSVARIQAVEELGDWHALLMLHDMERDCVTFCRGGQVEFNQYDGY